MSEHAKPLSAKHLSPLEATEVPDATLTYSDDDTLAPTTNEPQAHRSSTQGPNAPPPDETHPTHALQARQRLADRFDIVRPLGRGGMGAVYLARDLVLDREVAIKTLHTDHIDTRDRDRWLRIFRREATSTARLQHPFITTLHDFGIDPSAHAAGARPFMVLEYLQGRSLRDVLAEGPLDRNDAITLAIQLAEALTHAHAQGVIHRDLKPSNLFVLPGPRLKVLDFGIALLRQDSNEAPATEHGLNGAGTPLYMAPEQLLGEGQGLHTDIWTFGVVLFLMLSGRHPFTSPLEIVQQTAPDLAALNPDLPVSLVHLVQRCLQLDPGQRPAHAKALLGVLRSASDQTLNTNFGTHQHTRLTPLPDTFIGRETLLDRLHLHLHTTTRLLTLAGTAGTGKTRLAHELGLRATDRFDDIFFCQLADAHQRDHLIRAVAHTLHLRLDKGDPWQQLIHALQARQRTLLILDNVEQLLDPLRTFVAACLGPGIDLTLIITSREALDLEAEHIVRLGPLSCPPEDSSEQAIERSEAVRLFVNRAQQIQPAFRLDHRNRKDIAALVRALDGLPLAIELAAARVRVLSPGRMLAQMHRRFALLRSHRRDLSPRQATLYGALDASWELLDPWEQAAFTQLALFEGGFTLAAAEAVVDLDPWPQAPFVVDVIDALVNKSLLRRTQPNSLLSHHIPPPRFHMLVSVLDYARDRLGTHRAEVEARHTKYFARFGEEEVKDIVRGHSGMAWLEDLAHDTHNLTIAFRRGFEAGTKEQAAKALLGAVEVYALRGPLTHPIKELCQLIDEESLPPALRSRIGIAAGHLLWRVGDHTPARQHMLLQALTLARQANDPRLEGVALHWSAVVRWGRGENVRHLFNHARALLHALGDTHHESQALGHLAKMEAHRGRYDVARKAYQRGHALAQARGDLYYESIWYSYIASMDRLEGRLSEAHQGYTKALQQTQRIGDRRNAGIHIGNRALIDLRTGRLNEARRGFTEARTTAQQVGDRGSAALWLNNLARLELDQGHLGRAREYGTQALDEVTILNDKIGECVARGTLAHVDNLSGRLSDARRGFTQAFSLAKDVGFKRFEGVWTNYLASVKLAQGEVDDAIEDLKRGLHLGEALGDHHVKVSGLRYLAVAYLSHGALDAAQQCLQQALVLTDDANNVLDRGYILCLQGQLHCLTQRPDAALVALAEAQLIARAHHLTAHADLSQMIDRLRHHLESQTKA